LSIYKAFVSSNSFAAVALMFSKFVLCFSNDFSILADILFKLTSEDFKPTSLLAFDSLTS